LHIGWPADLSFYKLLTDWGSLIGGSFALIAGAALYCIGRVQANAVKEQTADLKRAERHRIARETPQAARMLDASLQLIEEDIVAAKDRYHTDDTNHIIAKGDATPIRQSINKPGFPFLWQHLGILHHEIPTLFMTLEIKIDELHAETQDTRSAD
jgi:hypothetical protein